MEILIMEKYYLTLLQRVLHMNEYDSKKVCCKLKMQPMD